MLGYGKSNLASYLKSEVRCKIILIGVQQGVTTNTGDIVEDISNIINIAIIAAMEKGVK